MNSNQNSFLIFVEENISEIVQNLVDDAASKIDRLSNHTSKEITHKRKRLFPNYHLYSHTFKASVVDAVKQRQLVEGSDLNKIIKDKAKQLQISHKNILRWYKSLQIKKRAGRRAFFPEMQQKLGNYIRQNPQKKKKVVIEKAKQILSEINQTQAEKFQFSKGWYDRFKERMIKKYKKLQCIALEQEKETQGELYQCQMKHISVSDNLIDK